MNNKGFIATSILYSFFIVFCAILLSYIGLLAHNSILIDKEKELIEEDLHTDINISDAPVGSYFRLNVCSTFELFRTNDSLNYVLINNNSSYVLLSSEVSYKLNNLEFLNNVLEKIVIKYKGVNTPSRSMSEDDYNLVNNLPNDLKKKILEITVDSNEDKVNYYLLANNSDTNYTGSKVYNTSTNIVSSFSNEYLDYTYIRLVFYINENLEIITGDGSYSNPYIMEGGAKCN